MMKLLWHKRNGWVYIPIHPFGFIVSLLAIASMVPVFIAVDKTAHSVTDELYTVFMYATCAAFCWKWITYKTIQ
jgi:hypothetical protein